MNQKNLMIADKEISSLVDQEENRQREQLQLIPSENYASRQVLAVQSSVLANKYSEGYPGKRFYQGNIFIDEIESLAIERVKKLFGAEHANIQPLSGVPANFATYLALLNPGDRILAMDLSAGGHLSHGGSFNVSGLLYQVSFYTVDRQTERIDYEEVSRLAEEIKPQLIIAGASAYPREIDFAKFGEIAKKVGAYFLADIAHIAGLVATGIHSSPVPYADVITMTTQKTLRGPRGGVILCKEEFAKKIDRAVFPGGVQGGPHNHVHAAKAICFAEAMKPEFRKYSQQVVKNAQVLADSLLSKGYCLVSGGTDNHLMLIDLRNKNLGGREVALALEKAGIILNKNMIPFDPASPVNPSGIRLGTPAITSRGMKESEMEKIADWIDQVLQLVDDEKSLLKIKKEVSEFSQQFPVPGLD